MNQRSGTGPVGPAKIDAERLAKLIDGRVSPAERDELLSQLDSNPEARAALSDASATIGELSPDARTVSTVIEPARRQRVLKFVAIPMAACLLVAVGLSVFLSQRGGRAVLSVPGTIAALSVGADKSTQWAERPWREFRGARQSVSQRGRAIRVGALIVELEALVAARDSGASRTASQIASLIDEFPGGGTAGELYRDLVSRDVLSADSRSRALRSVESLADGPALRVGAWLEAGRVAAAHGDSTFFGPGSTDASTRAARTLAAGDPKALGQIESLIQALRSSPRDWSGVGALLNSILAALAE
jgi:hypothetical protein